MAKQAKTSISESVLNSFLKKDHKGAKRVQLGCKKMPGLHVIKLQSGAASWRLNYTDIDGARVRHTIGNAHIMEPKHAAEKAALILAKLIEKESPGAGRKAKQAQKSKTQQKAAANELLNVGRYFEKIYTPYQITHRRTGKFILNGISNHFGHLFERDMDSLTGADITAWFYDKQAEKLSRVTITREFRAFKAMLNHAARPTKDSPPILASNPLKDVGLPEKTLADRNNQETKDKEGIKKRNVIPEAVKTQIRAGLDLFAEHIREQRRNSREHGKAYLKDLDAVEYPHWFVPFTQIALLTGMRPGDIRNMQWQEIEYNPFNDQTKLNFTPQKTKDRGENPAKVQFPVTGDLLDVLTKWRTQSGEPQTGYVFPSERVPGGILDKKAYFRHWARVKKLGGAPDDLDFYCFRHNFISRLVLQGAPVLAIARLVGHKDGTMIAENYFHLGNQDAADIITKLGENLAGNDTTTQQAAREARA